MIMTRYQFVALPMDGVAYGPIHINIPPGYKVHSWHVVGDRAVMLCEAEPEPSTPLLAHVPPEWAGPVLEWVKRWVMKT